jgi:hypothetical protein
MVVSDHLFALLSAALVLLAQTRYVFWVLSIILATLFVQVGNGLQIKNDL